MRTYIIATFAVSYSVSFWPGLDDHDPDDLGSTVGGEGIAFFEDPR